jgi:hypothetical protein
MAAVDMVTLQSPRPATRLQQYGRRKLGYHARHLLLYLGDRATNGLAVLKESAHRAAMQAKYGGDIARLLTKTYQLEVPEHNGR